MFTAFTKLFSSAFDSRKYKTQNNTKKANHNLGSKEIENITKEIYAGNKELEAILGVETFDRDAKIREDLTDAEIERAIKLYFTEYLTVDNYVDLYTKYIDGLKVDKDTLSCDDLFPVSYLKELYVVAMDVADELDKYLAEYYEKNTTREKRMETLRTIHSLPSLITFVHLNEYKLAMMNQMHNKIANSKR